ncbi:MAG TPA: N-acetylmuramoyl-L-alanine amidase [Acidimicrobiales bacterium]|nr:N-acetylmuramoyl-L-alanine amidase [Acidimicrobiales bacterium]
MRRTSTLLLVVVALVAAACSSGKQETADPPLRAQTISSTTTTEAPSTTTTEAPTTTTTEPPTTTIPPPGPLAGTTPKAVLTATGITVPVVGTEGDALLVGTPCGRTTPLKQGAPIDGTVVLDPGHGGVEPGAVGPGGLQERHLNVAVTNYARAALEANGVGVVLTRTGDYRITLAARAKIVKAIKPKAFVSIHFNAEPDGPRAGPGTETYYQTKGTSAAESKRLAGLIYEEVVKALSQFPDVSWMADTDAGAKYRTSSGGDDYYGIIRQTQGTPASLAELGFIVNPTEEALYARPEGQKAAGEGVANGILRFLRTKDPGSGFTEPYPREEPAGGGGGADNCQDPAIG